MEFKQKFTGEWWRWQESLLRKERVSHLQSLARGMVHDFSNTIAPVLGYLDLIQSSPEMLEDKDQLKFLIDSMTTAAKDAQASLGTLRDFYHSNPPSYSAERYGVVQVLEELQQGVLKSKLKGRSVRVGLSDSLQTWMDPGCCKRIFGELLENALQVVPEGEGVVEVTTGSCEAPGKEVFFWGILPENPLCISVLDNGPGFDPMVIPYCVEPFFTGQPDRRSGIGLSRVFGLLEYMGGGMMVRNRPSGGSEVRLFFPARVFGEATPYDWEDGAVRHHLHVLGLESSEVEGVSDVGGFEVSLHEDWASLLKTGCGEANCVWVVGESIPSDLALGLRQTLGSLYQSRFFLVLRRGCWPTEVGDPLPVRVREWETTEQLGELLSGLQLENSIY